MWNPRVRAESVRFPFTMGDSSQSKYENQVELVNSEADDLYALYHSLKKPYETDIALTHLSLMVIKYV